ncbi:MAG: hypothetical protein WCV72_04000 [Patescibacteria group bacterium]
MKKIFAAFALTLFLVGCGNQQSFLDEKIKCKELADERIEELKNNSQSIRVVLTEVNYSESDKSCLILYSNYQQDTGFVISDNIEDVLTYKLIASSPTVYNCIKDKTELRSSCENSVEKFNSIKEKYFPER